jgi:hypothetical protein
MDVLWKGLIGGGVTALIHLASKRGDVLPGILPLAPTFAVIALIAVAQKVATTGFAPPASPAPKPFPPISSFSLPAIGSSAASITGLRSWAASRRGSPRHSSCFLVRA